MIDETPAEAETVNPVVADEVEQSTPAKEEEAKNENLGEEEKPAKAEKTPAEKEHNRLAYQARKAEQEKQKALEEVAELRRKLAEKEQTTVPEPRLADFDTHEEWVKSWNRWDRKYGEDASKQVKQPEPPTQQSDPALVKFAQQGQAIRQAAPDFDSSMKSFAEIIDTDPDVSRAVASFAVTQTANAAEFLYELSKDQDFVYEIAATSPYEVWAKLKGRWNDINALKNPQKQVPSSAPPSSVKPRGKGRSEDQLSGRELLKKHGLR